MKPRGWIYYNEKTGMWQHKEWDERLNRADVLGEYKTRSDAVRASYGIK